MKTESKSGASDRQRGAADTESIVGAGPKINSRWKSHYRNLIKIRARLLSDSQDLLGDSLTVRPMNHLHPADDSIGESGRELAAQTLSSEQDELLEIEQALHRILDGTYGICQLTGKPIPADRLAALPWAAYTAEAQAELEKGRRRPAR